MKPSRVPFITLILVLVFFYLPIGFLVMNSFNTGIRFTGNGSMSMMRTSWNSL